MQRRPSGGGVNTGSSSTSPSQQSPPAPAKPAEPSMPLLDSPEQQQASAVLSMPLLDSPEQQQAVPVPERPHKSVKKKARTIQLTAAQKKAADDLRHQEQMEAAQVHYAADPLLPSPYTERLNTIATMQSFLKTDDKTEKTDSKMKGKLQALHQQVRAKADVVAKELFGAKSQPVASPPRTRSKSGVEPKPPDRYPYTPTKK